MSARLKLQEMTEDQLHISFSQVRTWLECGLKFRLQYVEGMAPEKTSINLLFGSSVHAALEHYYLEIMQKHRVPSLAELQELFSDGLRSEAGGCRSRLYFNKTIEDLETALSQGNAMLKALHSRTPVAPDEILGVEVPLSAPVFDENGCRQDMLLVGVIDLLLKGGNGIPGPVAVDHKTSRNAKKQDEADGDLQMSAYSYLLTANRYAMPDAPVSCRFQVLRKLKTPKVEIVNTVRTREDRRRLAKIITGVMQGIANRIFIPNRSWLCSDCGFAEACRKW